VKFYTIILSLAMGSLLWANPSAEKKREIPLPQKMVETSLDFYTEGASFSNGDLRTLRETSPDAIEAGDDAIHLAFSRINLGLWFASTEGVDFRAEFTHYMRWGTNPLERRQNTVPETGEEKMADEFFLSSAYLTGNLWENADFSLGLFLGRIPFSPDGDHLPPTREAKTATRESFLSPFLSKEIHRMDGGILSFSTGWAGTFSAVAEILHGGSRPEPDSIYGTYLPGDPEETQNFRGDTNSIRTGGVYHTPAISLGTNPGEGFHGTVYAYYTRYGASAYSGADRSLDGTAGNFADGDWVATGGTRWMADSSLGKEKLLYTKITLSGGVSSGMDYRLPAANGESGDIPANGFMALARGDLKIRKTRYYDSLSFTGEFSWHSGAEYDKDGKIRNYGFVGLGPSGDMGFLMSRYWGLNPSAYMSHSGIYSRDTALGFASGIQTIHAGISWGFSPNLLWRAQWWSLRDNSIRPGKTGKKELGMEFNFSLEWKIRKSWTLFAAYGIFLPGDYFTRTPDSMSEISGQDDFTGFLIGSKFSF